MPALLLTLLFLATFLLVRYWDDLSILLFRDKETVSIPETPLPERKRPVLTVLPGFFPKVPQDSAYTAAHPGWERYEEGGLGYLVFREGGRIGAIQVIAGTDAKLSDSFLRMCIRETTGLANGSGWMREQRGDFQIERGLLEDRGEVAVYRKMPEGEIRGFVLTFE
jgi:hypothetical protein